MVQIGVLAPMPSELRPVVRTMRLRRQDEGTWTGSVGDAQVVATGTGIGPALARAAAERLLARHDPDWVLVSGIAGGIECASRVGDLVVPEEAVDGGDGARYPATPIDGWTLAGAVRTGDVDSYRLTAQELVDLRADGVVALDMETAAIARVCQDHEIPWTAFRGISDMAGDETVGEEVMTLVRPDGSPDLRAAAAFFARRPWRLPRMVRLGRDAKAGALSAAEAAARAVATLGRPAPG